MLRHPERWGHLQSRYDNANPRRMLALDGGGIRGLITLGYLEKIEELLGRPLCDFFDYIAGTSTGAIIAACLAQGMSTARIIEFYEREGKAMFDKAGWLDWWRHTYESGPLSSTLQQTFGPGRTLAPEHLKTLLLVVTHNRTTQSLWPVSSNPEAKYNDPAHPKCNLRTPLWQLVRASTAAPTYFAPELIRLDADDPTRPFTFIDGGVTVHNNPSFLLYRMATHPAYRLEWKTGERNMLLVSIGTGMAPVKNAAKPGEPWKLANAVEVLESVMTSAQIDQDIDCRAIGRCTYGARIDSELGDMIPPNPLSDDLGRAFLYARYNVDLTADSLRNLGLFDIDAARVAEMDAVGQIANLLRIGRAAAALQVRKEHLGPFSA